MNIGGVMSCKLMLYVTLQSNLGKAESQQPGQARSATPAQGQGHTSSPDEREDGGSGALGSAGVGPSVVPGAAMDPSFGGAQDSDTTNPGGPAPYPYPTMSNGGSVPHY